MKELISKKERLDAWNEYRSTTIKEIVQFEGAIAQMKVYDKVEAIKRNGSKAEKRNMLASIDKEIGSYEDNIDARKVLLEKVIDPKIEELKGKIEKK